MNPLSYTVTRSAVERWAQDTGVALGDLERILQGVELSANQRVPSLQNRQRPTVYFPDLRTTPFWDRSAFSWTPVVEAIAGKARSEFEAATSKVEEMGQFKTVRTERGAWLVQYLSCIGRRDDRGMRTFPETGAVLSAIPGALSCGMAFFSTIVSNTHILPHYGFTNATLRCHLALSTTEGCRIRVSDEVRSWNEGELLIFDDTFEHEVWNESHASRVVLLFDVFHPDLSVEETRALEFMCTLWRKSQMRVALTSVPAL